jgi:hypothetical protein
MWKDDSTEELSEGNLAPHVMRARPGPTLFPSFPSSPELFSSTSFFIPRSECNYASLKITLACSDVTFS